MSKKVVIVGGGYAGVHVAKGCDRAFNVTLVAGRDMFHHDIGGMRASVVQEYQARLCPPYDKLLKRGKVMECEATRISHEEQTVTVSTGEEIPFDFLVLATGLMHPNTVGHAGGKMTLAERNAVFDQAHSEVSEATDILIVGGGPIGIEMAGEIKEVFPDKKVTLVTSKELMLYPDAPFPAKFGARLKTKLESFGVTVHTNGGRVNFDPADVDVCGFIPGRKTYKWSGGEMEADLCVVATGAKQVPRLYRNSGLEHWLDDRGMVKVEKTFEVKGAGGAGKVFAVGDCADLPIPKTAYAAALCGDAAAKSITSSAGGKPLRDVVPSIPGMSVVPVGSTGGVTLLPAGILLGDYLTTKIKSKGLLCGKFWGELNAGKPPLVP